MKSPIVLHPGMGDAVLNHLRQFGDLPNSGILAGQAVDSAITDLFGKGGGVYNDLDIFKNAPDTRRKNKDQWATRTTARSDLDIVTKHGYSEMMQVLELTRTYTIKSVSRKDMLNVVHCSMADGFLRRRLSAHQVIAGFDINCTRVAVDLATGQLAWDKHYEQFLQSRQLRISMMHTPWHTFLRLAKKAKELPGVYVDFDAAAEACVAVANSGFLDRMLDDRAVSLLFGKKHLEQAEATRSDWAPYFSLQEKPMVQLERGSWEFEAESEGSTLSGKRAELWQLAPRGQLNPTLQSRCDKLEVGVLFFAPKVIDEARRKKSAHTFKKLGDLVADRVRQIEKPHLDYVNACALHFGTDYVAGQALPAVADKVTAWLSKHGRFKKHLLGLSLDEQHARIQEISALAREYGKLHYEGDAEHALGVMETQAMTGDMQSREAILALLDKDRTEALQDLGATPLALPVKLPAVFADFTVTELLTGFELKREGRVMKHCVGGYSQAIRSGHSRILSIKYKDHTKSPHCSTMELCGSFKKDNYAEMNLRIGQNRTVLNKEPSPENKQLAEFLLGYLKVSDALATGTLPALTAKAETEHRSYVELESRLEMESARLQQQLDDVRKTLRNSRKEKETAEANVALFRTLTNVSDAAWINELALLAAPAAASETVEAVAAVEFDEYAEFRTPAAAAPATSRFWVTFPRLAELYDRLFGGPKMEQEAGTA